MKAVVQRRYGGPEALQVEEIARPEVGPKDVLVEVHASPVTQGDRRLRAADFPGVAKVLGRLMIGLWAPRNPVPGSMFAGRVVAVGEQATRFQIGDDVFGGGMGGAYAEYLAVPEDAAIARMPVGLGYVEAVALPYGAVTAVAFLRDLAKVRPGERVLVIGAGGGVGRYAVQLAHHLGGEVTAVAGGDASWLKDLGAHRIVDPTRPGGWADGSLYDVILDTTPTTTFWSTRRRLTPTGRYLSLYLSGSLVLASVVSRFLSGPRAIGGLAVETAALLDEVRQLAEQGAIRPNVDRRFPLEETADAHAYLEAARPRGEIVVEIRDGSAAPSLRGSAAA